MVTPGAIIGRQSVGASMLSALVQRGDHIPFTVCVNNSDDEKKLREAVQLAGGDPAALSLSYQGDLMAMARSGCLFAPVPGVGVRAWGRRLIGDDAYSIVGLTHTVCTPLVGEILSRTVTDPVQPWDALICTSHAVHDAVQAVFDHHRAYLDRRGIQAPNPVIQLPVIPLGIECGEYQESEAARIRARQFREARQIADDDVVLINFGRLNPLTKSHPTPLFQALERAQHRLGARRRLHLALVGQFPNVEVQKDTMVAARNHAPSLTVHWVDGGDAEPAADSWKAADIFISLSDNIQESFGLTPIEAMAAGLPTIVSDWDGYRETVLHDDTGIRIPTYLPTPDQGLGAYFADRHTANIDNYPLYVGGLAQVTAIDVAACADAVARLADSAELRQEMGERGRRRARSMFDWTVVLDQ